MIGIVTGLSIGVVGLILVSGIKIVRPDERAYVERFGKANRFCEAGFQWLIPFVEQINRQNITEQMMDVDSFEAITKERLNTKVDLVVYYKVKEDDKSVFKSLYKVNDFEKQIVRLAQTTARNVIGGISFEVLNSKRDYINQNLETILKKQGEFYGVEVTRVETKEITPPIQVQDSMNTVIVAENKKRASLDIATATETEADGKRRAKIKEAEGSKQASILEAQGKSQAFKLINASFKGNAQLLRKLEVTENALKDNAKIVLPEGKSLVNVIGDLTGSKK